MELAIMVEEATIVANASGALGQRLASMGPGLYQLAVRILNNEAEAEDVVQETFLQALRQMKTDVTEEERRVWLYRVASNKAKDHLRAEARRRKREVAVTTTKATVVGRSDEIVRALQVAMRTLDQKYRVPLALCYEQDFTKRDAATVLEMPERTLSRYVSVGLEKLRKALERAGYPAAIAAVLGGLKQTAPAVPASLAGRVEALVSSGAKAAPRKLASRAARRGSAAKGGYTMKLIAGVVLAGAVAAGAAILAPRENGVAPLPAEAPAAIPAGETVYKRVTLAGTAVAGYQDGPSTGSMLVHWDGDADDAGNVTWMERGWYAVVRRYDAKAKLVRTYGGSANGHLDGPIETARFSSGSYMACDDVRVSADGKWIYVGDPGYESGVLRIIDVEKGIVSTVQGLKQPKSFTVDGKGTCYVSTYGGIYRVTPDGKAEKLGHLKVREGSKGGYYARALEVDEANNILYAMAREGKNRFWRWDLKTGAATVLFDPADSGRGGRPKGVSGPAKGGSVLCPWGISINPAEAGKTFYWGGGDDVTFYRHNIQREWFDGFKAIAEGKFIFGATKRIKGKTQIKDGKVGTWANAPRWDSHGNMYFAWGIWPKLLTFRPVK